MTVMTSLIEWARWQVGMVTRGRMTFMTSLWVDSELN